MNREPDPTTQTGKRMMLIAWIIGVGLLTMIFGRWEKQQYNPNRAPETRLSGSTAEVVLQRNRAGHYVSSGEINGKPVTFLLDTGATDVAVPGALEFSLGLVRGPSFRAHTANGTATAYQTRINSLKIGNIYLTNVNASIVPAMQGEQILLGMSVLKGIEFHQKGDQLTLRQSL